MLGLTSEMARCESPPSQRRRVKASLYLLLLAVAAVAGLDLVAAKPAHAQAASFEPPRFSTNDTGDITIVGNTLLTCPTDTPNPTANRNCLNARNGTGSVLNNNDFNMEYVDVDDNGDTFNSSSAQFNLPEGGEVLFAGLYWGARMDPNDPAATGPRDEVSFGTPTLGPDNYVPIDGEIVGSVLGGGQNPYEAYHAFAEVTELVRAGGSGTYAVANVQARTRGQQSAEFHAGWSLVVVYREPGAPPRNLTVFDGMTPVATANPANPNVDVEISGFRTPDDGTVNARLGLVAYEGDLGTNGDSLRFRGGQCGGTGNFEPVSNALNPTNNFFNSTITRDGAHVGPSLKNPDYRNQLGFDIDVVDESGILGNNQTSACLRLKTTGDTYFPGVVTTAIDLHAPDVQLEKEVDLVEDLDGDGNADPDDILEYRVTATNRGDDQADDVVLTDAIPDDTAYVEDSLAVTQGANAGIKTDPAGDDEAEFATAPERVVFRLGEGANEVDGGTLEPGESTTIAVRVRVLESASGTVIENQASATVVARELGETFNKSSNVVETPVRPSADLEIRKVDSRDPVRVGTRFTYPLTVTNNGPNPARGVRVIDDLPNAVSFVSVTPSPPDCTGPGRRLGGRVRCDLGDLERGETATIEIVVEARRALGEVINTATVEGLEPEDRNPDNNRAVEETTIFRPPPPCADLTVNVKSPNRVKVGQKFAYTVTARNLGPADVSDAVLTSRLPRSVKFVRAGAGCRYDRAANKVTCALGDMPVGSKKQRKIVVKAQKAGTVSLQGCAVKSGTPDCDSSNNRLGSAGARSAGGEQSQPVSGVGPETTVVNVKEGSS